METRQQNPRIMVSPPTQGGVSQQRHARRPPAHRSVSLLHSNTQRDSRTDRSDSSGDTQLLSGYGSRPTKPVDAPSRLQHLGRNSSGESSNAENWFENSNNDVQTNSVSYMNDEPPYLMRNTSSSETPPQARLGQHVANGSCSNSLQVRAELLRLGTEGDSSEEYRGVIDDLTVENKKLKRRLKKYERLHDAHTKDEKLFEVRIHGMPAEKKRELEEMLRKFATGLGQDTAAKFPANGYEGLPAMLSKQQSKTADSAYASMSASAQGGSSAQSGSGSMHKDATPSLASRQQNVRSFLHHQFPEGLMPQPNMATMSERSKKKLVVRRLEQIFAGKGAGAVGLQHSQQQQEVSQTAARADRSAIEARGGTARQDGLREAHIMREDAELTKQGSPMEAPNDQLLLGKTERRDFADQLPGPSPNEQRPTRPLDLDPDRAQVPADNIWYMRHLGFSPRDPRSLISPEEGHGFVYLNLLISMAQLHTINVTPDFVSKALSEFSDKFEISQDGRKVRWKGGCLLSRTSSSGGNSVEHSQDDSVHAQHPSKRAKLSHGLNSSLNVQARGGATQRSHAHSNKFTYTPMFLRKDSTDEADESSMGTESDAMSPSFPAGTGKSGVTGPSGSGVRPTSSRKRQHNDGPIIFYNNAKFCTDLSGDRTPQDTLSGAPRYFKKSAQPIGKPQSANQAPSEKRGPLASAFELPEPMDLGDNPIPDSMELTFPPSRSPSIPDNLANGPVDFEVTGIGGVWPTDHFAIDVESRRVRTDQHVTAQVASMPSLPPKLARILGGRDSKRTPRTLVRTQPVASKMTELPPSALPPALGYMDIDEDTSSEGDYSDGDDEASPHSASHGALAPAAVPRRYHVSFTGSDEESAEEDEDDDSDTESDASLDLLATARELDPEAIRAREREYDAHMAERLAEEIPAGSSAATAGGGSGFASPASGVGRTEYQRAVNGARAPGVPGLRRASTGDSLLVQGPEGSTSSSGDSQDDEMVDGSIRS